MQQEKINVLSTRPLVDSLIDEAQQHGIYIDMISFISTASIQNKTIQQAIDNVALQPVTAVLTSMNAVEALAEKLKGVKPAWKIYCIGNTTQQLVKKYFGEQSITGTAANAAELAQLIITEKTVSEVYFFCGDKRRDDLPLLLNQQGIKVKEIVVYSTTAIPQHVEKNYKGILFFSPSAVGSFFEVNTLSADTCLFAIGNTTAEEIKKYASNKIIISDEPGKEQLVKKMINFLS